MPDYHVTEPASKTSSNFLLPDDLLEAQSQQRDTTAMLSGIQTAIEMVLCVSPSSLYYEKNNLTDEFQIQGREGHFMNVNVKAFDAPFFSMTPAEAACLDPQQRMLLECVYTAMENAGYTMADMKGTSTGVYTGAFMWDYRHILIKDVDSPMTYTATGTIASTLAGRISWFYDFRGPAFTVDTACSSSMVAIHQAVVGLRSGGCNMVCTVRKIKHLAL
jgi:acyl transferase domain-containing protein